MNTTAKRQNVTKTIRRKKPAIGIYSKMLITRTISVPIINVGNGIKETLERTIAKSIEGKCVVEGYVKPGTTKIVTYSSGTITGDSVSFEVAFECNACSPVEGMRILCVAKNITKAGIRAEIDDNPSPVVIFIARDHHNTMPYFSEVEEGRGIEVRVIGQRFELNDKYISIIAELIDPNKQKSTKSQKSSKPKLIIKDS